MGSAFRIALGFNNTVCILHVDRNYLRLQIDVLPFVAGEQFLDLQDDLIGMGPGQTVRQLHIPCRNGRNQTLVFGDRQYRRLIVEGLVIQPQQPPPVIQQPHEQTQIIGCARPRR